MVGDRPVRERTALALAAVPPFLWFVHFNVSYVLVPPSCGWGNRWSFALATAAALAGIGLATLGSWRAWRADRRFAPTDLVGFLGLLGVSMGALFALATFLVGASAWVVHPCR